MDLLLNNDVPRVIKLERALVCLDCEVVFTPGDKNRNTRCIACGGHTTHQLSRWLNRKDCEGWKRSE